MLGWVDLETTGLDPEAGAILEVAFVVTDDNLDPICRYERVAFAHPLFLEGHMDPFVREMHTKNGLLDEVKWSTYTAVDLDGLLACVYRDYVGDEKIPLAGSSVHFDRAFLARSMPRFERLFHYRNFDVSVIREAFRRWAPGVPEPDTESNKRHRAMDDLLDSIALARHYRTYMKEIP